MPLHDHLLLGGGVSAPAFELVISASTTSGYNFNSALTGAGWDGTSPANVTLTINSGIHVVAATTASPSLDIPALPAGSVVTIINNGTIAGRGGAGGEGSTDTSDLGGTGGNGGIGLRVRTSTNLTNNGTIGGGGGGGGGGGRLVFEDLPAPVEGYGAGGGAAFGAAGLGIVNGNAGTLTSGGAGIILPIDAIGGGSSGDGGDLGQDGEDGTSTFAPTVITPAGTANSAIDGVSFITFTVTGTILGAQV